ASLHPDHGANPFNIAAIRDRVEVRVANLCDRDAAAALVQGRDFIFNLAGQVSHLDSMREPFGDLEANCRTHLTLLEACRATNRGVKVVYASTRQVYGRPDYRPVDEQHAIPPPYINGLHNHPRPRHHA